MSVSIVTFANLGKIKNLKTADIVPVVDALDSTGNLGQVICQLHRRFYYPNAVSAIPGILWYPLRVLEKVTTYSFPRPRMEELFDYCAQFRLKKTDVVLFHGGHFLPRTFSKARALDAITIDLTVTAHPEANARLEKEEAGLLGLSEKEGAFTEIYSRGSHQNSFDYIIAISQFVKDSFIKAAYPTERIFVAEPDIDLKCFVPMEKKDTLFRAVYVAYSTPLKGLGYLLDAWDTLALPNSELVLVGGYGDMPEELKQRYDLVIKQNPSIKWVGHSSVPEKYYRDASVLVFPSLTEGFGRVTLEAMASGLPVITTENAKGIVEDGKTGFVVPIRDADALAEKIKYFYDHRDVAEQMGKEARKTIENKKPFGEAVYEIYREIMRREGKL